MSETAQSVLDQIARASYGKLLAILSVRTGNIQSSEDALSDAFQKALRDWPQTGVPKNAEGWLLTVARNNLSDQYRHIKIQNENTDLLELMQSEKFSEDTSLPDERLNLMMACAHPAIDPTVRTPLILQTVLGLNAEQIASAFITSPASMAKKLVRAKVKIKEAGIPFTIPEPEQYRERLENILESIFAVYGYSWDQAAGSASQANELTSEALYLAELVVQLMPSEPEASGLLSLLLFCESRKIARTQNGFTALNEQNTELWDMSSAQRAESLLAKAFELKKIGRFQIEAAIQSAHTARRMRDINTWPEILSLYQALLTESPTLGVYINYSIALTENEKIQEANLWLNQLPTEDVKNYQPFWVAKAYIAKKLNDRIGAENAYDRAIGLSSDEEIRKYLLHEKKKL